VKRIVLVDATGAELFSGFSLTALQEALQEEPPASTRRAAAAARHGFDAAEDVASDDPAAWPRAA